VTRRRTLLILGAALIVALAVYTVFFFPQRGAIVQFQPEAAMLVHATDPAGSLSVATGIGATSTPLPYAFSADICNKNTPNHFDCFKAYYQKLVSKYGVPVAFSDLKKRYPLDAFVSAQCHPLTHAIGFQAYNTYPSVTEAYAHGDSFCWSGYYHGVLEGAVAKIGWDNLPAKIDTICAQIPGKESYSFDYYNCIHGIGHGIMELESDDVFTSLKMCDHLTGSWQQSSCYGGVFMENIIAFGRDGSVPYLKKDQPLYPCTAVDDKYKAACYLGQTSFAVDQNGGNFTKIFELCATVAQPYRDICNQSLGRDAANYARHDAAQSKANCLLSPDTNDQYNCILGALKEMVSYYHSDTQAKTFCNILGGDQKSRCLADTGSYYKAF
jgi:hypothetical protein